MAAVARLPTATISRPRARRSRPDMRFARAIRGQKNSGSAKGSMPGRRRRGSARIRSKIERQIGHHDLSGGGEAEHGEARAKKRALAKEGEVHHRPLLDEFGRDKEREQ